MIWAISDGPYDVLNDEKLISVALLLKLDIKYAFRITRLKMPKQYENLNDEYIQTIFSYLSRYIVF